MSRWELLIQCIRSDQVSTAQIEAELRCPHFAAYFKQRMEERKANAR